jgi:hypothetical protein
MLRAIPGQKFLTLRTGSVVSDTLRALLYFAAWHSRERGPAFVIGSRAEQLAFWQDMVETVDALPCRKYLSFRESQTGVALTYIGRNNNQVVLESVGIVPHEVRDEGEPGFLVPLDPKALWVFLDWTTVPRVFLAQAPLGLVVPTWAPATL